MKKFVIFLFVALMGSLGARAQSTSIVTLSHNGEVKVYYGSDALEKAHQAADNGDVITLSAGSFGLSKITKAVTIRGAGMFPEDNGTIVVGTDGSSLRITIESNSHHLILEGLYFANSVIADKAYSPTVIKCQFDEGLIRTTGVCDSPTFLSCFFNGEVSTYYTGAVSFIGCYFGAGFKEYDNRTDNIKTFSNCIFNDVKDLSNTFVVNNSIIFGYSYYLNISSGAILKFCKVCSDDQDCLRLCTVINSEKLPQDTKCFKEGTRFELNDELVSTWLGDDDTQIGIYGGVLPFDPTLTNPQITKFNVANKTSADGKLSIDIEVSAVQ